MRWQLLYALGKVFGIKMQNKNIMKIVSLNTYGGRFFEPLMNFINEHSVDTDIFCFQEMLDTTEDITEEKRFRANFFEEISKALPDFNGKFSLRKTYATPGGPTDKNISFGFAIFVKNNLKVENSGDFFVLDQEDAASFSVDISLHLLHLKSQYVQLVIDGKLLTICNVHGVAFPSNKLDCPERLMQSKKILEFVNNQEGEKVVVGDFNLFPDTKSISMFEESGFKNLIKDFNIKTTRGTLVKQMHPEYATTPNGYQEFADFAFVTSGIKVKSFEVPDLPLSDHLPMIMEFNI